MVKHKISSKMKKITLLLVSLLAINILSAQETSDDFTLVVSSDGATKEEATHLALRSAIEQAYGTFVSANTTIINDKIVKDEIATVTSGNIKGYEEVNATQLQSGRYYVTLKATVSIGNLVSYAKSKGSSCELAGATFAQNVKLYKANKKAAEIALDNLINQLYEMGPYLFDYKVDVGDPVVSNPDAPEGSPISGKIRCYVRMFPTQTMDNFFKLITSTLNELTYDQNQCEIYENMGIESKAIYIEKLDLEKYRRENLLAEKPFTFIDLSPLMACIADIFDKCFLNFIIDFGGESFYAQKYWGDFFADSNNYLVKSCYKKLNISFYPDKFDRLHLRRKAGYYHDVFIAGESSGYFSHKYKVPGGAKLSSAYGYYNLTYEGIDHFLLEKKLSIDDFSKITSFTIRPAKQSFEKDYKKILNFYKERY